jgi:hypothetical protein
VLLLMRGGREKRVLEVDLHKECAVLCAMWQ